MAAAISVFVNVGQGTLARKNRVPMTNGEAGWRRV
jgi:hypothetical protein